MMAALLVALSVMAIMLGVALPAWRTLAQREKESELIFRGEQYARAIALYQRRYANASPPTLDVLVNEKFLRKKYKDPITGDDFQAITTGSPIPGDPPQGPGRGGPSPPAAPGGRSAAAGRAGLAAAAQQAGIAGRGGAGIIGVASKSTLRAFRLYNGRDTYNQWVFMGVQQSQRAGGPGGAAGGRGGADGRGGAGGRGDVDGRGGRDGRGGLQQPAPGRGVPPAGGRGQQPPQGQRGFGGRNFEN